MVQDNCVSSLVWLALGLVVFTAAEIGGHWGLFYHFSTFHSFPLCFLRSQLLRGVGFLHFLSFHVLPVQIPTLTINSHMLHPSVWKPIPIDSPYQI